VVTATLVNEAAPADAPVNERLNVLYAVSLDNAPAFTGAVEAVKHGMLGEHPETFFEKRSYLGHDLYIFSPPQPMTPEGQPPRPAPQGFSYAVTDHWVFLGIGSAAPVESALQGSSGKPASFWNRPEIRRNLLAALPENAHSFSYADLGVLAPLYFDTLARAFTGALVSVRAASRQKAAAAAQAAGGAAAAPVAAPEDPPVDPAAKPDAATIGQYWSFSRSYGWHDAGGTYGACLIENPPPQNP
jgi:hypothetical protein